MNTQPGPVRELVLRAKDRLGKPALPPVVLAAVRPVVLVEVKLLLAAVVLLPLVAVATVELLPLAEVDLLPLVPLVEVELVPLARALLVRPARPAMAKPRSAANPAVPVRSARVARWSRRPAGAMPTRPSPATARPAPPGRRRPLGAHAARRRKRRRSTGPRAWPPVVLLVGVELGLLGRSAPVLLAGVGLVPLASPTAMAGRPAVTARGTAVISRTRSC